MSEAAYIPAAELPPCGTCGGKWVERIEHSGLVIQGIRHDEKCPHRAVSPTDLARCSCPCPVHGRPVPPRP